MPTESDANARGELVCCPVCISMCTLNLASLNRMRGWREVDSMMRFIALLEEGTVLWRVWSQLVPELEDLSGEASWLADNS